MNTFVRKYLAAISLFGAAVAMPIPGCSPAGSPSESVQSEEEPEADGCPVGSDAQKPKPTGGACLWSLKYDTRGDVSWLSFTASCDGDATLVCTLTCPCVGDTRLSARPACQPGAVLEDPNCPVPPTPVSETKRITLPKGAPKCDPSNVTALQNRCTVAVTGSWDNRSVERECTSVCADTYPEGFVVDSGPQLCCIPQADGAGGAPPGPSATSSGAGGAPPSSVASSGGGFGAQP
jgi:hypothetical protein